MKRSFGVTVSDLNKDKVMECYGKLHTVLGEYMHEEYADEAHEATVLIMSTVIQTRCLLFKTNVEQTMEAVFNDIADYVYGMLEKKDED